MVFRSMTCAEISKRNIYRTSYSSWLRWVNRIRVWHF